MAPENVYWECGIGNIFKVSVSILPERKLFKHTRYAAILSKRIFDFIFDLAFSCTYIF
jgi:hypothetical protein